MNPFNIKCLISGEETQGRLATFEEIVAPHSGPPLHTHEDQIEVFHIISGSIVFELEGDRFTVDAGGTAVIPAGKTHSFTNATDQEAVIHFELLPAGKSEVFFEKLVAGDFEEIPVFFEEHGLKLMGPPLQ